jgi:hypothetical protein
VVFPSETGSLLLFVPGAWLGSLACGGGTGRAGGLLLAAQDIGRADIALYRWTASLGHGRHQALLAPYIPRIVTRVDRVLCPDGAVRAVDVELAATISRQVIPCCVPCSILREMT